MKRIDFLKDVLICSLGAYGGPSAHYGVYTDQLVTKKQYLDEEELTELIALCSVLPGPTSTQTIVSIGYKVGGPILAFLTMLVWALPVLIMMTVLSFLTVIMASMNISLEGLKYIGPMAVGFIIMAAYRIDKKVVKNYKTLFLLIFSALVTYMIRAPWIFPVVLLFGGMVSIVTSKEKNIWNHVKLNPKWIYLIVFVLFAAGSLLLAFISDNHLIDLFERFFRYGYLVFGGGQVVIPVMHTELVEVNAFMTNSEFLLGYGLVQGLPGPMFSFSAFAGGMASQGVSTAYQVAGAALSGLGIFLPGLLLIYFVYPIWENLKKIKAIKISLEGVNAIAGGLITISAVIMMQKNGISIENGLVTLVTVVLLYTKKVPAPLIVVLTLLLGFIL